MWAAQDAMSAGVQSNATGFLCPVRKICLLRLADERNLTAFPKLLGINLESIEGQEGATVPYDRV
jgi:hypothetical protein